MPILKHGRLIQSIQLPFYQVISAGRELLISPEPTKTVAIREPYLTLDNFTVMLKEAYDANFYFPFYLTRKYFEFTPEVPDLILDDFDVNRMHNLVRSFCSDFASTTVIEGIGKGAVRKLKI